MGFLRNLDLDRTSFWLGFLAGFLFLWLLGRLRPGFSRLLRNIRAGIVAARQKATAGADIRLRNEALRRAQSAHLAAALFPLDEVLLTPRLLAPPPPEIPGDPAVDELDITSLALPYLPDWPEMAALYRAPTFTLAEALQNGTSIVVIGGPGSGKSTALAHLATQMARREPLPGGIEKLTPLLLHATDFSLPGANPNDPLEALLTATGISTAAATQSRLPAFLETALAEGTLLLLLDGQDELPPPMLDQLCDYLGTLKARYPALRLVASASIEYYDGLSRLGCVPLAMAIWNQADRTAFIELWNAAWTAGGTLQPGGSSPADPAMLSAWLLGDTTPTTPFEFTLKTWAAYANDQLGPALTESIEAYLRRMVFDKNMQPLPQARPTLEQAALQLLLSNQPVLGQSDSGAAQPAPDSLEAGPLAESPLETPEESQSEPEVSPAPGSLKRVKITPLLSSLLENGLLVPVTGNRQRFNHLLISSYLAGYAMSELVGIDGILSGPEWSQRPGWDTRNQAVYFGLARGSLFSRLIEKTLTSDHAPLHQDLFNLARWLSLAPANANWRAPVMRRLASVLQENSLPLAMRLRAISAMVASGTPGIQTMLHQLGGSSSPELRQVAALGSGLFYNEKIAGDKATMDRLVADGIDLLADLHPNVRRAACLALVAIGNKPALEAMADALLTGDEDLRRTAAEALANHPEEGHPTLREGMTIEDLLVRRAVIYGLQRVNQPWSIEALQKIQLEEEEWLVKNAATHALESLALPSPSLPRLMPPLTETPWLIEFAGEMGIGVVPGRPAMDLLLKALQDGKEERVLAALDYLRQYGDEHAILPLYQLFYNSQGDVQDAACNTLWHLAASGVTLPPPEKFF